MWFIAKALQIIGLAQVLVGFVVGISQDDLRTELKIAIIGVAIFVVGRFLESKFSKT